MRHTLSVLTASCVLALGQPAWLPGAERTPYQRARSVTLCPQRDERRMHAALAQWQAEIAVHTRRLLPLNAILRAAQQWLLREGRMLASIVHAAPSIAPRWMPERLVPELDSAMVQRWLQPWLRSTQTV